jgi:NACHT domain
VKLSVATLEAVKRVESRVIDVERRKELNWLSLVNPYSNHTSARDKHGACTGEWFIESKEFLQWHESKQSSLWLTGIPGAGKTILCSTVIDFLQRTRKVNDAVFFFYFDFSDDQKQMVEALLRSLLRQACEVMDTIPADVMDLFESSQGHSRQISLDRKTLVGLLKIVFKSLESVTIVLDALDESSEVTSLLAFLHDLTLKDCENVKWLVTSRRKQEIEDSFLSTEMTIVPLENAFVDADIRHYVGECLAQDPRLSTKPDRIKQQIEVVLTEKARGMLVKPSLRQRVY